MLEKMKISFIIPTFNSEETIASCIGSILDQKNAMDEVIIVDNGSKDKTIDIVKKSGIKKIYVNSQYNISALRNLGVSKSSNELLAFIDSDCVLKSGWVRNVIDFMADSSIQVTGCKYDLPTDPNWIEKAWFSHKKKGIHKVNYINSGNLIIKREVFEQVSGFDESLITGEDSELCARILKQGYYIISNDRIGAIHLGNPKNLFGFYKKQYWHSLGMFGSFVVNKFDKPILATLLFLILNIIGIFLVIDSKAVLQGMCLMLTIPFFASIYRTLQSKKGEFFFQLIFLYYVYFLARITALFKIILNITKS